LFASPDCGVEAVNINISFNVPNPDGWEIPFSCPQCNFENIVTIGQIRQQEIIICSGCHADIHLVDKDGDFGNFKQSMDSAFGGFDE